MSIKGDVQQAMKEAMKAKDTARLECLRMAKGALLVVEKSRAKEAELSDDDAIQALRAEVKKRQQAIETFEQVNKPDEAERARGEIAVLEEFLPKQLDEAALEAKVRGYLAEHPELNHAGKLTGAMKKELGDLADGKMLNQICQKVLAG